MFAASRPRAATWGLIAALLVLVVVRLPGLGRGAALAGLILVVLFALVYLASLALLLHIMLIGPHYDDGLTFLGVLTYAAAAFLIVLELLRIRRNMQNRKAHRD